jgi:hypothetical protein
MKKLIRGYEIPARETAFGPTTSGVPCIHLRIAEDAGFHEIQKMEVRVL